MDVIGQLLSDRYRLEKKIGEGGMGQVFRATDIVTSEVVAVKILKEALSLKNTYLRRFKREIRTGILINHPGIVKLIDEGEFDGRPFLVMEYVEGQNLRHWAKNKRRSIPLILEKFEKICLGIESAHEKKMIHRDLKPENVLITYDGEVKIMDFGLARKINETSMITSPGTFIGTVVYTSPEQASGKRIDTRCDLYSIGVMMYEMVTGKLPFKGEDPIGVLFQHIHNEPTPVRELNKDIPEELEAFITRSMSKDPAMRPACALDMARDIRVLLDRMLRPEGPSADSSPLTPNQSVIDRGMDNDIETELLPKKKDLEMLKSQELIPGEIEVTFLLIELTGFVSATESLDYPTVQKFLDEYNLRLEDEILKYKGKVIQSGGHKSFYVFRAIDEENPAMAALDCACRIRKSSQSLKEISMYRQFMRLPLNIGIETGVIPGEMTTTDNLPKIISQGKYYHTATLIQNLSKAIAGDSILICGNTYERVKSRFQTKLYKKIFVRGRMDPVFVYSIPGSPGENHK